MLVTSYYSCKDKTRHVDSFLIGAMVFLLLLLINGHGGVRAMVVIFKYKRRRKWVTADP